MTLAHSTDDHAGCERIFTDHASGTVAERPELSRALDHLRRGDVFVVWRLDRLGRNLKDLIETVRVLGERGVGFRSLTENLDATTPEAGSCFTCSGASRSSRPI